MRITDTQLAIPFRNWLDPRLCDTLGAANA
jgi:hypothetical protein